jgi:hypothetical protein
MGGKFPFRAADFNLNLRVPFYSSSDNSIAFTGNGG